MGNADRPAGKDYSSHPSVSSVISGATKPEQVTANVKAGDWKLSAEELAEIDKIAKR